MRKEKAVSVSLEEQILGEIHAWQWERRLLRKLAVEGYIHPEKAEYCYDGMQEFLQDYHVDEWEDEYAPEESSGFVYPWNNYDGHSTDALEVAKEDIDLSIYSNKGLLRVYTDISTAHAAWLTRLANNLKGAHEDSHISKRTLTHALRELGLVLQDYRAVTVTAEFDYVLAIPQDASDVVSASSLRETVERQVMQALPFLVKKLDSAGVLVTNNNIHYYQEELELDVSIPNVDVKVED
jgi:nucleotide-binding universal stress UspA family protein